MRQRTLAAQSGFERYTKKTRRAEFLEEMEQGVPWAGLCALIEPGYPPAVEEALYESVSLRGFVDIDLGREPAPDETTVCKFRQLLEEHQLGARIFERVQEHLQERGLRIGTGTIVDATIVHAPSSTKNREQKRDPEMHQTRKGKQWYFGMKAHVGVDSKSKLIHAVVAKPANVADSRVLPDLLHGDETRAWGDQAYRGQGRVLEECAAGTRFHLPTLPL